MANLRAMQETFTRAAGRYEFVNHVLTFGLDIVWRRRAARRAAAGGGGRWLDLCAGTGDMAVALRRLAGDDPDIVAADLTAAMLAELAGKPEAVGIALAVADARLLPFASDTFDLVTLSFATRNLNLSREALLAALREAHRVLRPGGRLVNVETSQPANPLVRWSFHRYVALVVTPVGALLSGSRAAYAYLSHTIPRFCEAEELADVLREAGFAEVDFTRMMLGLAAIHTATKLHDPRALESPPTGPEKAPTA